MHSNSDALPGGEYPSPATRPRFPEHTLLSLFLMLLLSAGTLYGVDRALEESVTVVQSWQFNSPGDDDGPWTFPAFDLVHAISGTSYTASQTGPGPMLTLEFDAATVHRIRVTMGVTRLADGRPIPFALEWYWSSPEQVASAAGSWPFSTDRGKPFYQPDRHNPEVYLVDIDQHERWKGQIGKAFISVKLPDAAAGPYRVETKKIEFLE